MKGPLRLFVALSCAVACQRQPLLPVVVPLGAEPSGDAAVVPQHAGAQLEASSVVYKSQTPTEAEQERAQTLYKERCALCHGRAGHGDGIAAVNLRPSPRSLSDASWQASVDDADIAKIIVVGGLGVQKSRMMPASPDLKDEPGIVSGLVHIVRGFKEP